MKNQNNFDENDYGAYHQPGSRRGMLPSIQSLEQHFSRSMELLQPPPLSLTLGSHIPQSHLLVDDSYASSSTSTSYETEIFATVVGNSKFLAPAQSLLEETVNVGGKSIDFSSDESIMRLGLRRNAGREALGISPQFQAELCSDGVSSECQTRITTLISLLDKLESKYEQYYRRMEELVSSFEMIAGLGSAKSYTALTLQAMSRHFNSLREAIINHIRLSKNQFTQGPGARNGGALQQLGMIRNQRQTWRPTRGLPETSVGILRSWLFEHFLHPYPNDSEKLMLASQTGLTKNQVSNWFINARVRLWKPMIEEMYKEELGESSMDSNQSECMSTTEKSASDHADV